MQRAAGSLIAGDVRDLGRVRGRGLVRQRRWQIEGPGVSCDHGIAQKSGAFVDRDLLSRVQTRAEPSHQLRGAVVGRRAAGELTLRRTHVVEVRHRRRGEWCRRVHRERERIRWRAFDPRRAGDHGSERVGLTIYQARDIECPVVTHHAGGSEQCASLVDANGLACQQCRRQRAVQHRSNVVGHGARDEMPLVHADVVVEGKDAGHIGWQVGRHGQRELAGLTRRAVVAGLVGDHGGVRVRVVCEIAELEAPLSAGDHRVAQQLAILKHLNGVARIQTGGQGALQHRRRIIRLASRWEGARETAYVVVVTGDRCPDVGTDGVYRQREGFRDRAQVARRVHDLGDIGVVGCVGQTAELQTPARTLHIGDAHLNRVRANHAVDVDLLAPRQRVGHRAMEHR